MMRISLLGVLLAVLTGSTPETAPARFLYPVEPNHSTIQFSIPIAGGLTRVTGKFTRFTVDMLHAQGDPSQWEVTANIEVASIDTGIAMRDRDLQKPMFFDAEHYPKISFKSQRIEKTPQGYVAVGRLSMRGTTRQFQLPFKLRRIQEPGGRNILAVSARASLNRNDFGVGTTFKHTLIKNFLGKEIQVEIDLWTKSGKEVGSSSGQPQHHS